MAADGTVYATQTVGTGRVYKITPDGEASVLIEGEPLALPNGIVLDNDGNIVVVNIEHYRRPDLRAGRQAAEDRAGPCSPGNDGIVIMADGTKYVSSVRRGGLSRIRPGKPPALIANGIPNGASMCLDPSPEPSW